MLHELIPQEHAPDVKYSGFSQNIYILYDYLHTTTCPDNLPKNFPQQFQGGCWKYLIYCCRDTADPYSDGSPVHTWLRWPVNILFRILGTKFGDTQEEYSTYSWEGPIHVLTALLCAYDYLDFHVFILNFGCNGSAGWAAVFGISHILLGWGGWWVVWVVGGVGGVWDSNDRHMTLSWCISFDPDSPSWHIIFDPDSLSWCVTFDPSCLTTCPDMSALILMVCPDMLPLSHPVLTACQLWSWQLILTCQLQAMCVLMTHVDMSPLAISLSLLGDPLDGVNTTIKYQFFFTVQYMASDWARPLTSPSTLTHPCIFWKIYSYHYKPYLNVNTKFWGEHAIHMWLPGQIWPGVVHHQP